jgi:hypothetical protein
MHRRFEREIDTAKEARLDTVQCDTVHLSRHAEMHVRYQGNRGPRRLIGSSRADFLPLMLRVGLFHIDGYS